LPIFRKKVNLNVCVVPRTGLSVCMSVWLARLVKALAAPGADKLDSGSLQGRSNEE